MDTNQFPIDRHLAEALAEEEVNRMSHEALKETLTDKIYQEYAKLSFDDLKRLILYNYGNKQLLKLYREASRLRQVAIKNGYYPNHPEYVDRLLKEETYQNFIRRKTNDLS
tara:strand:+ start:10734 stop:11066 length:333 start_codon:yes stop_codon:yes gene_type:complete